MMVMGKLRDLYAAADYSTAFLEAAIRKAGIHIAPISSSSPIPKASPVATVEDLVDAGRRLDMQSLSNTAAASAHLHRSTLTPPPDTVPGNGTTNLHSLEKLPNERNVTDEEVARRLETFLASTPPESDHDATSSGDQHASITISESTPSGSGSGSGSDKSQSQSQSQSHFNPFSSIGFNNQNHTNLNAFDLPPNPFSHSHSHAHSHSNPHSLPQHQDSETLFSSLPMHHEFDDGDFDSLLNLDAVGETFNFDEGVLETGGAELQMSDGLTGGMGMDWMAGGGVLEDVRA
jgi:hypothetical protein